jgi:hypothetical protein
LDLYQAWAYLPSIDKFSGFCPPVMKESQMTVTSKVSTTPGVGSTGLKGFASKVSKVVFNRSVAIVWWTGLAALMAAFRLATNSGAEGDEMFRAWMIDWAVIWFALATFSLRLLKPIFDYLVSEQNAHADASMLREISKLEPSFAQELRSMALHQQMRDEQAAEASAAASEALAPLGGLTPASASKPKSVDSLGSGLSTAT